ncbi:PR-1-like protein [Cylindrobasidium torrendii FP15055 ss-10]|uniref:PR-1-like protein n=1 Tax=Cylindrobasidium torrendii FP15055 ss-10 TaxID=1314674 RepID=A0A0D7BNY6_9AGAR|nr:PR-1-like protein [Cylindrobasidium torrendii FP15055 ss-10]
MILPNALLLFISTGLVMGASIQQRTDSVEAAEPYDERTVIGYALDERDDAAAQEDFKTAVVRQHNEARAKYGAGKLTWSDALYADTQKWANQCKFQHSGGNYGENLAAGTGNFGFKNGLDSWMSEASKYDYNHPGFSSETGHFTQVVWKNTKQVACAVGDCKAGTIFDQASKYVVCRYSPPGNYQGQFPQNVGRPQ